MIAMYTCNCTSGQPVGWCVSDLETSEVITTFLGALKKQSPGTAVSVIMTDDGDLLKTYCTSKHTLSL